MIAWYAGGAALILALIVFLLFGLERGTLGTSVDRLTARVAETLVFVGLGYCTKEIPGVVKLGGVVPMGWVCAALALIAEYAALDRRTVLRLPGGVARMSLLILALVCQAIFNPPWGLHTHDDDQLIVGFVAVALWSIWSIIASARAPAAR